jgi:large subunit ribosomal protein L25
MTDLLLEAKTRENTAKARVIRDSGLIPAVLYGHKTKNAHLTVPYSAFMKVYAEAGSNTLVDLKVSDGNPVKVLIHDIDHDVVSNKVSHIDFYQVRMDEKINAEIPVHFVGEAPVVKEMGGTLVTQIEAIPVKCLPKDLIKFVEVDLSSLVDFEKAIRIKDVSLSNELEIQKEENDVVASVSAPRVETEETPAEEEVEEGATEEGAKPAEGAEGEKGGTPAGDAEKASATPSEEKPSK